MRGRSQGKHQYFWSEHLETWNCHNCQQFRWKKTLKGADFEGRNQLFNFECVKFEVSIRSQVVNWIYESGVQARDQGNGYKFGSHQHIYSRMVFKALGDINSYEERTTPLLGQGDRTKTSG